MTLPENSGRASPPNENPSTCREASGRLVPPLTAKSMMRKISRLRELPTLPNVAVRLNTMLQDINIPAQELSDFIVKDQAVVTKILKLVNSPFFGFSPKVTSIRHAIMLMGYNTIRNAVLSISVVDSLKLAHKFNGFDISYFWEHAIAVGAISHYLDEWSGNRFKEDSFTAGLVHDIGKIIMANFFPDTFAELLKKMACERLSFSEAEKHCFPLGHGRVGTHLSKCWNLPEIMQETIAFHHRPKTKGPINELVLIVYVADALAHCYFESGNFDKLGPLNQTAWGKMGDCIRKANQWLPLLTDEIKTASALLLRG